MQQDPALTFRDGALSCPGMGVSITTSVPEPVTWAMLLAGFGMLAPYHAQIAIEREDGSTLGDACDSAGLKTGAACAMSSGDGLLSQIPAMNHDGTLTVQMDPVDPAHMVAGAYSDVITINVQAKL